MTGLAAVCSSVLGVVAVLAAMIVADVGARAWFVFLVAIALLYVGQMAQFWHVVDGIDVPGWVDLLLWAALLFFAICGFAAVLSM